MSDKQLIPFSKELWETGEYETEIYPNGNWHRVYDADEDGIYGRINLCVHKWNIDGSTDPEHLRLMLRKKTRKVWRATYWSEGEYNSKEECEALHNFGSYFIKAIEVEI